MNGEQWCEPMPDEQKRVKQCVYALQYWYLLVWTCFMRWLNGAT